MTLEQLRDRLARLVEEHGGSFSAKIKADSQLFDELMRRTSTLDPRVKLKTRVYRVLNGIDYVPKCQNCGNDMLDRDVKSLREGYRKYCCQRCAKDSADRKALYEKTCMDRYGARNASSSPGVKAKRRVTNVERLGVDNPAKSAAVLEKIRRTNLERYGEACAAQSAHARAKTAATNLERYGVESFSKTRLFVEKTVASNIRRFGVAYPNQDPAVRRLAQKRYTYEGVGFDSAPELAFFIYARDRGLDVEYQPAARFEYSARGKTYRYQPDFRLGGRFIELKGAHFFEGKNPAGRMINPYDRSQDDIYEAKRQCMLRNGVEIVVDFSEYTKYVEGKYGKGYLRGFRNGRRA